MRTHEWDAVVAARSNLLIEGHAADTERFVRELVSHLPAPVVSFPDAGGILHDDAVVLVAGVDRLGDGDQRDLMAAMDRAAGRLQVISTSATPLFDRVERGEFLPALYYRLNTIWIALWPGCGTP